MPKRRRTFPLTIGLSIVGGVAAVGLAGWYYWTGTVYYSLHQIRQAVTRHDRYLFEKHVDLDNLTRRFIDDALAVFTDELQQEVTGAWQQMATTIGMTVIQLLKPRLIEEVRQAVIRGVESGSLKQGDIWPAHRSDNEQVNDVIVEFVSNMPKAKPLQLGPIHVFGSSAMVELTVQPEDQLPPQTLHVRLVRTPERYWRATDIDNTKDIMAALKKSEEQRLELANQPIRQALDGLITVVTVSTEQGLNAWGTGKDVMLVLRLKNTSPRTIQAFVAHVVINDLTGARLHQVDVAGNNPIAPGEIKEQTWSLGLNLLDDVDQQLYAAASTALIFKTQVQKVVFADGQAIKLAESLQEAAAFTQKAQDRQNTQASRSASPKAL